MASLTESSVGSVPKWKIAQLHDELLKTADNAQQPQAEDETHLSGAATSASKDVGSTVPESTNAYHTPISSPRPPPRLSASRSAPAAEMEAMLHPSPSQEAFTNLTRANSFHGFPEGDTQVMESQVYRDYTASIVKSTTTTPKKAILQVHISPGGDTTYNTIMPDNTPKTCVEGDPGYVDLYMPSSPGQLSTSSHVDELLDNPQTQQGAEHEFTRPALPQTPGLAGNKRNSNGEIVTSSSTTKKTPGFTQVFGGHENVPMLSATQMFDQTQAPSSPQPNEPRSDPVITRPSPIVQNHASLSSPVFPTTSPVRMMHSRPSTATEPRGDYTSLEESQRRRQKIREELMSRAQYSIDTNEEELEEEIDREVARYEQARRRREMNEHAKEEWSKVRVSSRPSSRPTSRQNSSQQDAVTIDLVTPAPNKEMPIDYDISDDDIYHSDDNILLEDDEVDEARDSDDEYDELGQEVLRSQPHNQDDDEDEERARRDDDDNASEDADMYEAPRFDRNHNDGHTNEHNRSDTGRSAMATQHSAIADSQPGVQFSRPNASQQIPGGSSIPSVIPGSQLGTRIMQDHLAAVASTSSIESNVKRLHHEEDKELPSSPPPELPKLPRETSNASEAYPAVTRTIPESDLPDSDNEDAVPPGSQKLNNTGERENNALLYSTARTHASGSGPSPRKDNVIASPLKALASQQSKVYSQSPRTAAGVRYFADIAGAASTPQGSGETEVDVDAIVSDVVTADDQHFMELVSTPSAKRQIKRRKTKHESSNDLPTTGISDVLSEVPPKPVEAAAERKVPGQDELMDKLVTFEEPMQDRTEKGVQSREATPPTDGIDKSTPESAKKREQAGAKAASQLLSKRMSTPKKTLKTYGRNIRQRSSTAQTTPRSAGKQDSKPKRTQENHDDRQANDLVNERVVNATIEEIEMMDHDANDEIPAADDTNEIIAGDQLMDAQNSTIRAPNRVLALFKGQPAGYWPATYLGANADMSTCRVKFDDGTVTTLETQHMCRLEFVVGDAVRVDLQDMRNIWQVVGFGSVVKDSKASASTDVYGHTTVRVQPKAARKSSTNEHDAKSASETTTAEVPVAALYLTRTMWPAFTNRMMLSLSAPGEAANGTNTPSSRNSPAAADISASRSGRTLLPTARALGSRTSHVRDESTSTRESPAAQGLFTGMAFAISYGSNEGEKAEVSRLIRSNGGIILEQGFDELFTLPNLDDSTPTSPGKKSGSKKAPADTDDPGLQLKADYNTIGFVALIADRHSRRAKYVQALALSLPTLSGKWIFDSLNHTKNTSNVAPLPWSKYLLPAGESSYLGGAIRSRTMSYYKAQNAELSNTISNRDILLGDEGVLIVVSKKSKSNWERRKAFAFLTLALGAAWVKRVSDLAEAKTLATAEPEKWKWVYVDGSVTDASTSLFGKANSAGKKRKRGEDNVKIDEKAMWATDGRLKIVNDEFVVQSLILGALVD